MEAAVQQIEFGLLLCCTSLPIQEVVLHCTATVPFFIYILRHLHTVYYMCQTSMTTLSLSLSLSLSHTHTHTHTLTHMYTYTFILYSTPKNLSEQNIHHNRQQS